MSDLVHKCRGKIVVYVLLCEPCPETGNEIRYVGVSKDCERRTAQHCGVQPGGAKWTAEHVPIDIISVRIVDSDEEAAVMECMLFTLHAAKIGYNFMCGGRWNMVAKMLHPPPGFSDKHADPPEEILPCPRLITGKEEFKHLAGIK